jgi:predicted protein tyrosine phosphatase
VLGENELVESLERGERHYRACISIGNPRPRLRRAEPGELMPPLLRSSFDSVLRLSFYDLVEPLWIEGRWLGRLPRASDARRVLRFFERSRGWTDGWTIHCWAGISRSTAVALGLLFLLHGDEGLAAAELRRMRPQALPNLRLVGLFDRELGSRLEAEARRIHSAAAEELGRELEAASAKLEGIEGELEELGEPETG